MIKFQKRFFDISVNISLQCHPRPTVCTRTILYTLVFCDTEWNHGFQFGFVFAIWFEFGYVLQKCSNVYYFGLRESSNNILGVLTKCNSTNPVSRGTSK